MKCSECIYREELSATSFCKRIHRESKRNILPECFCFRNRYLLKYMDEGGSSNIYYAYDLQRKEIVVMKELYLEGAYRGRDENGSLVPYEEEKERVRKKLVLLVKEAKKLSKLQSINILPVIYDIYYESEKYDACIIMELLEGNRIFDAKIRTSKGILKLFKPLIIGVKEMHVQNIIHRDLTAHNLLLVDQKIKLLDLGISTRIRDEKYYTNDTKLEDTRYLETSVAVENPPEHQEQGYQDSRTDVYILADTMLQMYEKLGISTPKKIRNSLEKARVSSIEGRYNIEELYNCLYGEADKRKISKLIIFIIVILIAGITVIAVRMKDENHVQNEDVEVQKNTLISLIEDASGRKIQEQYVEYADFDGNGDKEMAAFIPIKVREGNEWEQNDQNYEWIETAEVWFCDGERTVKIEEIEKDDYLGGGYYDMSLIQFGDTYHVQLYKSYGIAPPNNGRVYIYVYEGNEFKKNYEGVMVDDPVVDGGEDTGAYYVVNADKGFTGLHGRTQDKIYIYYKEGKRIAYASELIELSKLKEYENYEEIIWESVNLVCLKNGFESLEGATTIEEEYEDVKGESVDVFKCSREGNVCYITLVSAYLNESGRIYINMTAWYKKEDFKMSNIWSHDNVVYPDPIDPECSFENEGANYYITFKINKSQLEIEEVTGGFWEKFESMEEIVY